MNSVHREPLPDTRLDYFDVHETVEATQLGAYTELSYTSHVFAENLVCRRALAILEASLCQLAKCKYDPDFPWYPARVVCHDTPG